MLHPIGTAEGGGVNGLGRGKKFFKGWVKLGDRQHLKNAAAVIIDQHNGQVTDKMWLEQKAIRVMQQRQIAREHDGGRLTVSDPQGRGQAAINPIGTAIEEGTQMAIAGLPKKLHIAHGRAAANKKRRVRRQRLGQDPGDFAFK